MGRQEGWEAGGSGGEDESREMARVTDSTGGYPDLWSGPRSGDLITYLSRDTDGWDLTDGRGSLSGDLEPLGLS